MENSKNISEELIQHYLFGYKDMRLVSSEEVISTLLKGQVRKSTGLPESPPLSPRKIRTPEEISLCSSSLPGCKFGACAIKRIQHGTWFGPFEGKLVRTTEVAGMTTDYMWEIFHDGEVSHFLDGFNENNWMAFVRCARYKKEQNLVVFQYHGCIYYRSTKDILPGNELLVWYDNKYTQLLGIPLTWNDSRGSTNKRKASLSINTDDQTKLKKRDKAGPLSLLQKIDYKPSGVSTKKSDMDFASKMYDISSPSNVDGAPTTAPLRCDKCFFSFHTKDQLLTHKCLSAQWLPPLRLPSLDKTPPFHRPIHVNTPYSDTNSSYYQNYYHYLSYAYPSPPMEPVKHYGASHAPPHPSKGMVLKTIR